MSKLISKAKNMATAAGASVLSQTPVRIDNFDLTVIGAGSDAGLRVGGLDAERVKDYAEDMESAPDYGGFPPIVLVKDAAASMYWVARGNHRIAAARAAKFSTFPALVYTGTKRDAHILALGDNAAHGLRRTRADMQNELTMVLSDPELGKWSDGEIAKIVRCSRKTVQTARAELVKAGAIEDDGTRKFTDKHGNEQTMNVAATKAANTRTPLTDDELEVVVRTELARRITSGRLNDKIAWLLSHRTAAHYAGVIAKERTVSDEQVLRVADALRAELEQARDDLAARNERTANRYNANASFVAAQPPSGAEDDDEGTGTPDDAPNAAEPAQAPAATGDDALAAQVSIAKAKVAELAQFKRLAELLELAMPLVENFARVRPEQFEVWANGNAVESLTTWLYDLADLARAASK